MNKYKIRVILDFEDIVEAENEEEAFIIASDYAMSGGAWQCDCEKIEEDD